MLTLQRVKKLCEGGSKYTDLKRIRCALFFSLILLFWHSRVGARDQPGLYLLKVSSTDLRKNEEDVFENGSDHFEFVIIKVLKDKHDNGGDDPNEQVDASLKKKKFLETDRVW